MPTKAKLFSGLCKGPDYGGNRVKANGLDPLSGENEFGFEVTPGGYDSRTQRVGIGAGEAVWLRLYTRHV